MERRSAVVASLGIGRGFVGLGYQEIMIYNGSVWLLASFKEEFWLSEQEKCLNFSTNCSTATVPQKRPLKYEVCFCLDYTVLDRNNKTTFQPPVHT
jgi:hypothetical protein